MSDLRKAALRHAMPAATHSSSSSSADSEPAAALAAAVSLAPGTCEPTSWESCFTECRTIECPSPAANLQVYLGGTSGAVFVLIHGAGHSALSWALVARNLIANNCRVMAIDLRAHGGSNGNEADLSIDVLRDDVIHVIRSVYGEADLPSLIVVGHSMGGAVATHVAASKAFGSGLKALVVVDVVEGTAVEALPAMVDIIRKRPKTFASVSDAIEWSVTSKTIKNLESARISFPSQIVPCEEGGSYRWRTDLMATRPLWDGWFQGLSNLFLTTPVPRLLLLAGTDRLDKPLMIGQMQGKFQTQILPQCGHAIQEDAPDDVAQALLRFKSYNRL